MHIAITIKTIGFKFLTIFIIGFNTMVNSASFTSEQQLITRFDNEISTFWQQGLFDSFSGKKSGPKEIKIHYAKFLNPNNQRCLVLVPGRSESYLKFKELSYDLYNQGYDIFIIDHRGQGLSGRMLSNHQKGHVENFQYYVDDLTYFIESIVNLHCKSKSNNLKPYLLAHSMGGAISALYLQQSPNTIQAAVLSSPMLGFRSIGIPKLFLSTIIKASWQLNQWVGKESWYFIGQKEFVEDSFEKNNLMHSPLRFQQFMHLYKTTPEIQLGGITIQWLIESMKALDNIFLNIKEITTPLIVLQSGEDKIIENQAQNDFCRQLNTFTKQSCPNGLPTVIAGAYHELFFERDEYRNKALETTLSWFQKH